MSSLLQLSSLPTPLVVLLLTAFIPTASAGNATGNLNTVGFWLSFSLIVIISAIEAACSALWTRFRVISDGTQMAKLSCRIFGREVFVNAIDWKTEEEILSSGLHAGCHSSSHSSVTVSHNDVVVHSRTRSNGCSCCGGVERMRSEVHGGTAVAVIDKFGSLMLVPTLLIRRFNPATSLLAPKGLLANVRDLVKAGKEDSIASTLEHAVHLLVGLTDIALSVAGLALTPDSPQRLYRTLKNPVAPMKFENYLTLFLLYWLLGALLLVCMMPLSSKKKGVQAIGWVGAIAFGIATLASVVLFGLGCWKIDYARRHHLAWTPMLSYWIGGASAISFPIFGIEVFHTFGVVGLVFMLIHTLP
jgi:hypothetical protein